MSKIKNIRLWGFLLSILVLSACVPIPVEIFPTKTIVSAATPESTSPSYWSPSPSDTFQIQLSDYPPDLSIDAEVFELDLFETSQEIIESLHKAGKKVVCYLNAGAWEQYRPDAGDFPDAVLGKDYIGWEGERWLDISNYEAFRSSISARFDLALSKDCDGVDADNINGFQHDTGFEITAQDQLTYNIWLSEQAHQRALAIGMKNNNEQVADLVDYFDFAILEGCTTYDECENFHPFSKQAKAVFQIEYTDSLSSLEDFCSNSMANGYIGILKNRNLDARVQSCHLP